MSGVPALAVLVLAKTPRPGHSKTRLIPAFGAHGSAALAAAALADTLDLVRRTVAQRRLLVLDGSSESLSCSDFQVIPQTSGSHSERIVAAFEAAPRDCTALLIGMDTPQANPAVLDLDLGLPVDAWLGPAEDGGWWALGLRHPHRDARRLISGVPTSTPHTGALQRRRLVDAGLAVADLPPLRDVDEPADAFAVAEGAPAGRFARCLAAIVAADGVNPHEQPALRDRPPRAR